MKWTTTIPMFALAVLALGGCTATIVPPVTADGQPTLPVHVADYGYHSSLILPRHSGGLIEYAYGDWNYFAHSNKSVGTALEAMLASKQATLGRRVIARSPDQPGLKQAIGATTVLRFDAPRDKVRQLERDLEQRFDTRMDSILWSTPQQLYFVMDSEKYGLGNNCNDLTARWLEQLGCEVKGKGWVLGSHFALAPPAPRVTKSIEDEGKGAEVAGGK